MGKKLNQEVLEKAESLVGKVISYYKNPNPKIKWDSGNIYSIDLPGYPKDGWFPYVKMASELREYNGFLVGVKTYSEFAVLPEVDNEERVWIKFDNVRKIMIPLKLMETIDEVYCKVKNALDLDKKMQLVELGKLKPIYEDEDVPYEEDELGEETLELLKYERENNIRYYFPW